MDLTPLLAALPPEAPPDLARLGELARIELRVLGALVLGVVAFKLVTGRINLEGLLRVKVPGGLGELSPARVQLLLMTLVAAVTIPLNLAAMQQQEKLFIGSEASVLLLGGSNAIYLVGKYLAHRAST